MHEESESSLIKPLAGHVSEQVEPLELGAGSRQHVFHKLCRDGRYYFLKSLRAEYLGQTFYREVLRKEYELGARLRSDYIVAYHELIDTPEACSLVMDYVDGSTLDVFVSDHPDYFATAAHQTKFLWQLCQALDALHTHQALHLDLKPSNIMLTRVNHDVRLIDLGCCYTDSRPHLMGRTTQYAAPEQLDGSNDVDARTDIYAIGKILETLLPPPSSLHRQPSFLHLQPSSLHRQPFKRIARRCLKERKEERFQSVEEILALLDRKFNKAKLGRGILTFIIAAVLLAVLVVMLWRSPSKGGTAPIADGTVFVDTLYEDTLFLRVLSANDHSLALIAPTDSSFVYRGDIVLPDSVVFRGETFFIRELADEAMRSCSLLTNIHFPPTLTTIRRGAMRSCKGIANLHLPPSLTTLHFEPFVDCINLRHVSWPSSATVVPRNCFVACRSLRRITLPEGVTAILQDAFTACDSLEDVMLPSTLERLDRGVFYRCRSLRRITLPENVKTLGEYLFYGCSSLEEIRMLSPTPPAISTIVDSTFHGVIIVPASSLDAYRHAPGWKDLPCVKI